MAWTVFTVGMQGWLGVGILEVGYGPGGGGEVDSMGRDRALQDDGPSFVLTLLI